MSKRSSDEEQETKQASKQVKQATHLPKAVVERVNAALRKTFMSVAANIPASSTISGERISSADKDKFASVITVFEKGVQVCFSREDVNLRVSVILEGEFDPDTGLLDARSGMVSTVCSTIKNYDTAPMNCVWVVAREDPVKATDKVKFRLNAAGQKIEVALESYVFCLISGQLSLEGAKEAPAKASDDEAPAADK